MKKLSKLIKTGFNTPKENKESVDQKTNLKKKVFQKKHRVITFDEELGKILARKPHLRSLYKDDLKKDLVRN